MAAKEFNAQVLREVLHYDPENGVFTWRKRLKIALVGEPAGTVDKLGYIRIQVRGNRHLAHRLAWLYMTGEWPASDVDHINGHPGDNSWKNLRDVSRSVNMQNQRRARADNCTGLQGASLRGTGKYRAVITVGDKSLNLGQFDTAEEAHAAYVNAKRKLHQGCTI